MKPFILQKDMEGKCTKFVKLSITRQNINRNIKNNAILNFEKLVYLLSVYQYKISCIQFQKISVSNCAIGASSLHNPTGQPRLYLS